MKALVIAEKPSVARDIARVLKCTKNISGAIEGEKYVVTWALGHLVTLADPEEYSKEYKEWKMEVLPMMTKPMKLIVIRGTAKQYRAVKALFREKISREVSLQQMQEEKGEACSWRDGFLRKRQQDAKADQAPLDFFCDR